MAHKRLSISDRQEQLDELADVLREVHGAVGGMPVRGERKGLTRQELDKKYPALNGHPLGVPAGRTVFDTDEHEEVRRAMGR